MCCDRTRKFRSAGLPFPRPFVEMV